MALDNFFDVSNDQKVRTVLVVDFMNLVFRTLNSSQRANPLDLEFDLWKRSLIVTLFSYVTKFNPDRVVIALDEKNSWRKEIYPSYKGQRKDARDASVINYEKFFSIYPAFEKDFMENFSSFVFMKVDRAEADDVIAVLAKKFSKTGTNIICVSNDSDLHQLLKFKNYSQYNPLSSQMVEVYDPVFFLNSKILLGDTSDNIPHVAERMGKKTAEKEAKRLDEFLSISSEEVKKNFKRNKMLIDLELVPVDISTAIEEQYDKYETRKVDGFNLYSFFVSHKQARMTEDSPKYLHRLNKLV